MTSAPRACELIYSSELVPGSLRVQREPAGTTPVAVLEQVLAEHGLRAKPVGNDTFAIVREPEAVADTRRAGAQGSGDSRWRKS